MTQSQQWLMEIGGWTVIIGMIAALAGLVIFTVRLWWIALDRVVDAHGGTRSVQEFLRWKKEQNQKDLQG